MSDTLSRNGFRSCMWLSDLCERQLLWTLLLVSSSLFVRFAFMLVRSSLRVYCVSHRNMLHDADFAGDSLVPSRPQAGPRSGCWLLNFFAHFLCYCFLSSYCWCFAYLVVVQLVWEHVHRGGLWSIDLWSPLTLTLFHNLLKKGKWTFYDGFEFNLCISNNIINLIVLFKAYLVLFTWTDSKTQRSFRFVAVPVIEKLLT